MDKYEKRAMEWCPDELDHAYHSDKHPCKAIAAALRESAAEALAVEAQHWEDLLRPGQEVSGSEIKARLWMVADQAKALRGKVGP